MGNYFSIDGTIAKSIRKIVKKFNKEKIDLGATISPFVTELARSIQNLQNEYGNPNLLCQDLGYPSCDSLYGDIINDCNQAINNPDFILPSGLTFMTCQSFMLWFVPMMESGGISEEFCIAAGYSSCQSMIENLQEEDYVGDGSNAIEEWIINYCLYITNYYLISTISHVLPI